MLLAGQSAARATKDPLKETFLQPTEGAHLAAYHGAVVGRPEPPASPDSISGPSTPPPPLA